jgi:hypothetical protein
MDEIASTTGQPRVVALLFVPWSMHAMRSAKALAQLASVLETRGIQTIRLDEEDRSTRDWINMAPVSECLKGDWARGAGAILLLEFGSIVEVVFGHEQFTSVELLYKINERW